MIIMYKCHCMDAERQVQVTERPHNGDLILWMECVVAGTIRVHHHAENPRCTYDTMEYVKIPVDENAEGIGQKPRLAS